MMLNYVPTSAVNLLTTSYKHHVVYTISCKCGQEHIGEEGSPLGARLKEYKHNLKDGLFGKSKLALYATEKEQKTVLYSKF